MKKRLTFGLGIAVTLFTAWFWFFGYQCGLNDAYYLVYVSCEAAGGGGSGAS